MFLSLDIPALVSSLAKQPAGHLLAYLSLLVTLQVSLYWQLSTLSVDNSDREELRLDSHTVNQFNSSSPLLFIGGVPKSGTTLMRVLLDIHPDIRCGPETHVIIDLLKLRYEWANFGHLKKRNEAAGVTNQIIDKAVAAFILEVVARHGEPAHMICNKEPFLMTQAGFLSSSFPSSHIIHMVRDGRAVSHSLVSRNLEFPPFSPTDHRQNLKSWAGLSTGMHHICGKIGPDRCRTVRYEDLVENTERVVKELLSWLSLPWHPDILRHHELLDTVRTSGMETTGDQISQPLYQEAVSRWRGNIPGDVLADNIKWAAALRTFGYTLFQ